MLRGQLFGAVPPGTLVTGFHILVRRGLAAWSRYRPQPEVPVMCEPRSSVSPRMEHDDACATLAKLIANWILIPKSEMPTCPM
jgi:hypothetical protein